MVIGVCIATLFQVDSLLESFTADLDITPKQLAEACSQSSTLGESHQVGRFKVSIIFHYNTVKKL